MTGHRSAADGSSRAAIARSAGFDLLGADLGNAVRDAIKTALRTRGTVAGGRTPLAVFRHGLQAALSAIENDPRGEEFQRFLLRGPYPEAGRFPARRAAGKYLTDEETARVIRYVTGHMVNSFQGFVAEMLALAPVCELLTHLKASRTLPEDVRLYAGDAVRTPRRAGVAMAKGADAHLLAVSARTGRIAVEVAGVVEVKSYRIARREIDRQLRRHVARVRQGLELLGRPVPRSRVRLARHVVRVSVVPADWTLPRTFHWEPTLENRKLVVASAPRPGKIAELREVAPHGWAITLPWSREALAQAAYDMTFWYMGKVGEAVFATHPNPWPEMSPAAAGRNAAEQAMYYAPMRARTLRQWRRAVLLYNVYGFGYALGAHFKNRRGGLQMLWPDDLDEILAKGKARRSCTFH